MSGAILLLAAATKLLLPRVSSAAFLELLRNVPLSNRELRPVSIRCHLFCLCACKRSENILIFFFS